MDKNVLQSIAGIEVYPLISLAIFFLFFVGLLAYVLLANRQHISTMSQLPLAPDNTSDETLYHLNPDVLC
ncbi:hypothetical protein [Hymenobacter chitinivorans]|uniref:Cbb3-type cytochrome oxidase component FixQ n=1 Tax=Hymenobacter chitinivorans DSM 11115 TaxID=1121954 RepID=A0A2M9BP75_9BACT|nr:hypothetical protein [Hymenobacter chitinivorans]PJJ59751.1 hypothetical protein CLV45_1173 [Hymenobacter chitinivorans DSM 11115]